MGNCEYEILEVQFYMHNGKKKKRVKKKKKRAGNGNSINGGMSEYDNFS